MATYTVQSQVVGEARLEPANGDMVEIIDVGVRVLKDGVNIGEFRKVFAASASNEAIRIEILGAIRDVVEQELVGEAQTALDQRAAAIKSALDTWEKVI